VLALKSLKTKLVAVVMGAAGVFEPSLERKLAIGVT
jgi:hypothetical protein